MIGSNMVWVALSGARMNAIVVAALELRLCEFLSQGPATVNELAERAGISARGAQAIADGMVALKLWQVQAGKYSNGPAAEECLVRGKEGYVGDEQVGLFRAWAPAFTHLGEHIKTGRPAFQGEALLDFWQLLTPTLAKSNRAAAKRTAQWLSGLGSVSRLLDVGGGAGALYSVEFLSAHAGARATQVDWLEINAQAREAAERAGCAQRFATLDGDFHHVDFGREQYGAVVLSHVIHQETEAQAAELLRRAREALLPGGWLVVAEWVVDDGRASPAPSLLFNLAMLLLSEGGKAYERGWLQGHIRDAGFKEPEVVPVDSGTTLLFAQRDEKV
jgi:SAM-dependent methyltransferase